MSDSVELTVGCDPAATGTEIHFPAAGPAPKASHILVEGNDTTKILKVDHRRDGGTGACVSASVAHAFGGEGAKVSYRKIGTGERVMRDSKLFVQFLITLLTIVGAGLSATSAYIKNKDAVGFEGDIAVLVLLVAAGLALFKLVKDIQEL